MSNTRIFNGVIFTNHALERLTQRNIKQGDAWATLIHPSSSRASSGNKGSWVFYKTYGYRKIEVVASKNERSEWVVLSVWDKVADGQKTGQADKDPIWKRVLRELAGIFQR